MNTEEQKQQYLKDVSEASERVKQYVKTQHSPELQRKEQATFERVPLAGGNGMPPMLSLNATAGSGSTLEMWEEGVDQRLNEIDGKLEKSDLSSMFQKGELDQMDF